ncbi:hypothetical protein [Capnocytophaga endodontalis]|uniref:Uncharacterized protein n=1 Tax=Capnocytophaga endodontalis TaxID=2708117 RepID=A0A1Z4BMC8_9FLAO|nr:hypothetical protein [Capnocytophaga endodontalis]ASF42456.1 hypothetical protein CBG49_04860 [Capnocytophaga endodontalis]
MAGIRITLKETGQQSIARLWVYNPNEEKEPDYLIHFRRPEDYYGEFGFDWMRDNYHDNTVIDSDYEKLKKEYYDCEKNEKVELSKNKEYFVPWLSIFPEQEKSELKQKVKLKIEVEKLNNYQIQDDDYIEIPSKAGVIFNPNKIKVSEINKNTTIEVICKEPLERDICITAIDKNNIEVGKLNIIKNNGNYHLPIQLVKIITNKGNKGDNEEASRKLSPSNIEILKKELQNKYYNQPLIHLKFLPIKEVVIDIDEFKKKGVLSFHQDEMGEISIVRALKNFDEEVFNKYFKGFKGIVILLSAINENDITEGHAKVFPLDTHYVFIIPTSLTNSLTIAHELGHVLGLFHSSFQGKENEKNIKETLNKYKNNPPKEINYGGRIYPIKQFLDIKKRELNTLPKHVFKPFQTDNFMESTNAGAPQKSFWKWQWLKMQEEIKLYHNEK